MVNILDKIKKEFVLGNYSPRTRKAYLYYIKDYIDFCNRNRFKNKNLTINQYILNQYLMILSLNLKKIKDF